MLFFLKRFPCLNDFIVDRELGWRGGGGGGERGIASLLKLRCSLE